ncbi:MAG TPA: transketolase [Longimicrobiales bacterium]|nr:transketolase [Longimicrobiales bacterium]
MSTIDDLSINTLRFLAADAVEQANSGHPGLPMGAAAMAYVLWQNHLRHDPSDPKWLDRDRFVLSAGHGSMLLYGLLHLTGYDLPIDQLRNFRQFGSLTPGHPEAHITAGVEATTGPLGQGFGNAVGMAIAERFLAARFNRPGHTLIDHYTYAICSDGDLMEGVASEAASLAGHLGLGKLIALYDDNEISIDGSTDLAFTEDVEARFEAYGWHVEHVEDGNDLDAVDAAIREAQAEADVPSLIAVRTHIGFGSPKQDTADAHGSPLGEAALIASKERLGWPLAPRFLIPVEVARHMGAAKTRGAGLSHTWREKLEAYRAEEPELAAELERLMRHELPGGWDSALPVFEASAKPMATRAASGKAINALAGALPTLIGGSADLAPSNNTTITGAPAHSRDEHGGRNFHFGVREHAMGATLNGMALHGGIIPYGGTFLIFSDYMRPSMRLAALTGLHVIYVLTHDSIGLGEDGPTHQPVEHLMSLRAIPHLTVIRPADANETVEAWRIAIGRGGATATGGKGPVVLALSRQNLPILDTNAAPMRDGVARGAYVLREAGSGATGAAAASPEPAGDAHAAPGLVFLATGSEVELCLRAGARLEAEHGLRVRVVSMPCWELFAEQPQDYRRAVLPPDVPKVAVEAGVTLGWERWVGADGLILGLDRFGASAPGKEALERLGFNEDNVVEFGLRAVRDVAPEPTLG